MYYKITFTKETILYNASQLNLHHTIFFKSNHNHIKPN